MQSGAQRVDNAASLQLQGDKVAFPILDTLPNQGEDPETDFLKQSHGKYKALGYFVQIYICRWEAEN